MKKYTYSENLISSKTFTAEEKILLGIIMEPELVRFKNKRFYKMKWPCKLTAGELGKLLGVSRKKVEERINELVDKGWMTSIKYPDYWARETQLTDRFYQEIGLIAE